jgi:excinuclease ABC subunit C
VETSARYPLEVLTQYPLSSDAVDDIFEGVNIRVRCSSSSSSRSERHVDEEVAIPEGGISGISGLTGAEANDMFDRRAMEFAVANVEAAASRYQSKQAVSDLALADLQQLLGISDTPVRIEAFDISHTQGVGTVASCVVFVDGQPARSQYRTISIVPTIGQRGNDDYASMEQAVYTRFSKRTGGGGSGVRGKQQSTTIPNVVLIDGGKGQLGAAMSGLERARAVNKNIPKSIFLCALAKSNEDLYVFRKHGYRDNTDADIDADTEADGDIILLKSDKDQPALRLLRAIRDASHSYALGTHRRKRSKINGLVPKA